MQGSEILIPNWFWIVFLFAIGCCVGSFLNVVIYRLPRDKSLVRPPSSCPSCGKHIQFYDNVPLVSWLLLCGKCRYCKTRISPRYFVIELLTGLVFVGTFALYFHSGLRHGIPAFLSGGWVLYLISVILFSALIASSAIDLEMWIIPLSICWFATAAGLLGGAIAPLLIHPATIRHYFLMPMTADLIFVNHTTVASLVIGATIGLGISLLLLATGILKRSYDFSKIQKSSENPEEPADSTSQSGSGQANSPQAEGEFNDRFEMFREVLFLLPIIVCALAASQIVNQCPALHQWWLVFSQRPVVEGFMGSLAGYFVGCTVVWATRILGTLAFGREAMGLGDVHLMGAAGTVIGPLFIIIAFFVAPFFGLVWAAAQLFSKKTRQIPYGPFLSIGIVVVMIFHDGIIDYLKVVFGR
ncbi:MAG: prepilin peptidase [Sedimentisphaerales bacterium]|jgi:leader peptidase (prepilin peptidase)/N-methyltransferase